MAVGGHARALGRPGGGGRGVGRGGGLGVLHGELGQGPLDLLPHPAHRDPEDPLAALDQVDDLVGAGALVDRGAVAHEGNSGQVLDAALVEGVDGHADLLERDAGVQEPLDDLEQQDVAEGVEPLGARAPGAPDRGLDQAGTGPVVELTVGDAGDAAGDGPPVPGVGVEVGQRVTEEHGLGALGHGVETRAGSTHGPAPVMNHGTHTGGVRCGVVYASHREHIRPPGGTPVARARRLHGSLLSQPRLEV